MAFNLSSIGGLKKKFQIEPLNETTLIEPQHYISTGNYAVNKVISGSMFKGIPNNRITTFYGESGCVPFDSKIYVLVKADVEINEVLHKIASDDILDTMLENVSLPDQINLLTAIGYSKTEISNRTGVTRQSIYNISNKRYHNKRIHRGENSISHKVGLLLKKNIYRMPMSGVKFLKYHDIDFLVLTPVGFRKCTKFVDKGERETYIIAVSDCETTTVSKDHLIQIEDGSFENAENMFNAYQVGIYEPKIRTIHGPKNLLSIREGGYERVCDIEIDDPISAYYVDDIVAHNSGKSLIVTEIIINAIKSNNYDTVFYIDTEGGILSTKFAATLDDDEMKKIMYTPIGNIEECNEFLASLYRGLQEQRVAIDDKIRSTKDAKEKEKLENEKPRVMVILDSYSGLFPKDMIDKAADGKIAADMGRAAKARNAMIKPLMVPVMISGCPLVMICHSYKNLNAMGPQKFDVISGGEGVKYASHLVVQSSKSKKRQEDAELGLKGGGSYYAKNLIRYITMKDRLVIDGLEATLDVDYKNGISRYEGLWDDAVRLGFIVREGNFYTVPSWSEPDKKFKRQDLVENDEIWETFLVKMDKIFKQETAYNNKEFRKTISYDDIPQDELDELEAK